SGIQNGFLAGRVPAQQKNGGKRDLRHNAPLRRPRQCAHVSGALENTGFRLKLRPPTRSQQDAFTRSKKAPPRAGLFTGDPAIPAAIRRPVTAPAQPPVLRLPSQPPLSPALQG